MTEKMLLGALDSVLEIIKNQDFRNPQHMEKVQRLHLRLTDRLEVMGSGLKANQLRFEVSDRSPKMFDFVPKIVDELPVTNSIAGWINEPDGRSRSVKREVVGRTYIMTIEGKVVVFTEYFQAEGDKDEDLFRIARKHNGLRGPEGKITRAVFRQEAETLLFTDYEDHEKSKERIMFKPVVPERELVAA